MYRSRTGPLRPFRPQLEALEPRLPLSADALGALSPDAFREDRILVRFESPATTQSSIVDGTVVGPALHAQGDLYAVYLDAGVSPIAAAAAYERLPGVVYAQPDYALQLTAEPIDGLASSLSALSSSMVGGGPAAAAVQGLTAAAANQASGLIVVGVVDTGVDYRHVDLANYIWTNPKEVPGNGKDDDGNGYIDDVHGWDFVNRDNDPDDDNGHGTHVAGIIAAGGNGSGMAAGMTGIASNIRLLPLKFMGADGRGFVSDAIAALDYARLNGAMIVNNSWSGAGFSQALADAISRYQQAGGIYVAAAGNSSQNNDLWPTYPANYAHDNVIAVAATDGSGRLASFSNFGATQVDVAAPGARVHSTLPGDRYGYMSGTSMAAPHVSGALAELWSQYPDWSYQRVVQQLLDHTRSMAGGYVATGQLDLEAALNSATAAEPIQPAQIVAASWIGSDHSSVSGARLTLSEPLAASALRDAVVRVSGPNGDITISSLTLRSSREVDVRFATQTTAGQYLVRVDRLGSAVSRQFSTRLPSPLSVKWQGELMLRDARADMPGKTTVSFTVNQRSVIDDINLRLQLSHARSRDLRITLSSPDGHRVVLWDRQASNGASLRILWDDEQSTAPSGWLLGAASAALRAFDGGNSQGKWQLTIEDFAPGARGVLNGLELQIGARPSAAASSLSSAVAWTGYVAAADGAMHSWMESATESATESGTEFAAADWPARVRSLRVPVQPDAAPPARAAVATTRLLGSALRPSVDEQTLDDLLADWIART